MSGSVLLALAALSAPAAALSGMATTTRYYDGQEGACGCGTSSGLFSWQTGLGDNIYTAAGSQALFDADGATWCGSGCGLCYELVSTGVAPSGEGTGGTAGETITVMITNLCPYDGNAEWCPEPGEENAFGYEYHFDIMASSSALDPIIGDNPIVSFSSVTCPSVATSDYKECVCATSSATVSSTTSTSTTSSTSTGTVAEYGQCGGENYTGPTACASPYTCQEVNEYYYQCL